MPVFPACTVAKNISWLSSFHCLHLNLELLPSLFQQLQPVRFNTGFVVFICMFELLAHTQLSIILSICCFLLLLLLSILPAIHPSVIPSFHLSVRPSIHPSIHPSIRLSVCLSPCLSVCLFSNAPLARFQKNRQPRFNQALQAYTWGVSYEVIRCCQV